MGRRPTLRQWAAQPMAFLVCSKSGTELRSRLRHGRTAHRSQERSTMRAFSRGDWRQRLALGGLLVIVSLQLVPLTTYAQNLGQQPATGQAVQGQTAAQPEGAVLNLVNW